MPFEIVKKGNYYKIYKINEGVFAKPRFKTRQSAINQAKNWLRYRHELPRKLKKKKLKNKK